MIFEELGVVTTETEVASRTHIDDNRVRLSILTCHRPRQRLLRLRRDAISLSFPVPTGVRCLMDTLQCVRRQPRRQLWALSSDHVIITIV